MLRKTSNLLASWYLPAAKTVKIAALTGLVLASLPEANACRLLRAEGAAVARTSAFTGTTTHVARPTTLVQARTYATGRTMLNRNWTTVLKATLATSTMAGMAALAEADKGPANELPFLSAAQAELLKTAQIIGEDKFFSEDVIKLMEKQKRTFVCHLLADKRPIMLSRFEVPKTNEADRGFRHFSFYPRTGDFRVINEILIVGQEGHSGYTHNGPYVDVWVQLNTKNWNEFQKASFERFYPYNPLRKQGDMSEMAYMDGQDLAIMQLFLSQDPDMVYIKLAYNPLFYKEKNCIANFALFGALSEDAARLLMAQIAFEADLAKGKRARAEELQVALLELTSSLRSKK